MSETLRGFMKERGRPYSYPAIQQIFQNMSVVFGFISNTAEVNNCIAVHFNTVDGLKKETNKCTYTLWKSGIWRAKAFCEEICLKAYFGSKDFQCFLTVRS